MPPRKENVFFSRAVKKSHVLFRTGKLFSGSLIFIGGWLKVISVLAVAFLTWNFYRAPRRYLSRHGFSLPRGAVRRVFLWLGRPVRAGAAGVRVVAGRLRLGLVSGRRLLAGSLIFIGAWLRVIAILSVTFLTGILYRAPRRCLSRHALPFLRGPVRVAGGWLWLGTVRVIAPGDRYLVRVAEKLDEWGGPVLGAVWRALGRTGILVFGPCRAAGGRWAQAAGRSWQVLGERYRRSRLAAFPLSYQLLGGVLALALILVPYELAWGKTALAVTVKGQVIGQVAGRDEVWVALQQLEETNSRLYGVPVQPMDTVDIAWVHPGGPFLAGDALRFQLARYVRFGVPAAGISINGQVRLVLPDAATANKTLQDYAARYQVNGADVRFEESVAVMPAVVPAPEVLSEEKALAVLGASGTRPATYTVKEGDTLSQLAQTFHTSVDALAQDNPGMDVNRLGLGEVINLERPVHLVNVLATYRATLYENVPYQVQWQRDPGLYYGQVKLVQAGRLGKEQVVAVVTEENGIQVKRQVLQQQVLQAPVPEIEGTGGNIQLASRGGYYHGGRLIWPASGPINSPFGWRTIFGGREFHSGIDIGAGYGQPVFAAAAGVVTFAGWEGGYGHMVMVSHGDGLSTLYAHLSRVFVNVGDSVGQGRELGLIGETGDATGPHLHFEVRENGTPVNPMYFL